MTISYHSRLGLSFRFGPVKCSLPPTPVGVGQRPSQAKGLQDHADGQIEVALLRCMDHCVSIGLGEAGAAVIIPGAHVDGGTAVGGTDDFDVLGDVLHVSFLLFLIQSCCLIGC